MIFDPLYPFGMDYADFRDRASYDEAGDLIFS
jgi:hypothetical protein